MNEQIDEIYRNLINFDPGFKENETAVKAAIAKLLAAKPDTRFDPAFAERLRAELSGRIRSIRAEVAVPAASLFSRQWFYALAGAAAVIVLILPAYFIFGPQGNAPLSLDTSREVGRIGSGSGITKLAAGAFGSLSVQSQADGAATLGRGGGGGGGGTATAAPLAESAGQDAKMIMPPIDSVTWKYIYKGEALDLSGSTVDVWRRVKAGAGASELGRLISNLDYDVFALNKLQSAAISNVTINEDRDFGFSVNLNLLDNQVDLYANYQKWPQIWAECNTMAPEASQACFESKRLKYEEIPADSELVAIANAFIREYGLNIANYGEPTVQDFWRQEYLRADDKRLVYIPDSVTVVYPLKLNDETVVDEGGNPTGLYISIDVRQRKVSGVNSIIAPRFESSSYAAITDQAAVMKVVERGGLYPDYFPEGAARTVELELGTPERKLMRYWRFDQVQGTSEELYIPALVFPIVKGTDEVPYLGKKYVVVPLVQEFVDSIGQGGYPMPLMKGEDPAAASGGEGSAPSAGATETVTAPAITPEVILEAR